MMLVLPSNRLRSGDTAAPVVPAVSDRAIDADETPCRAMVARGVELAHSGDRVGAEDAYARQPVIARAAGLRPRQMLTPEAFGRALRRLRDLPVVASNAARGLRGGATTLSVGWSRAWP